MKVSPLFPDHIKIPLDRITLTASVSFQKLFDCAWKRLWPFTWLSCVTYYPIPPGLVVILAAFFFAALQFIDRWPGLPPYKESGTVCARYGSEQGALWGNFSEVKIFVKVYLIIDYFLTALQYCPLVDVHYMYICIYGNTLCNHVLHVILK